MVDDTVNRLWYTFLKPEKSWTNKLYRWFNGTEDLRVDDYVHYLASLQQATFRQEVNFLIRLLRAAHIEISSFEARLWRTTANKVEILRKSARIPTHGQISRFLNDLDLREKMFILILSASGRRSVDISRINSSQVKFMGDKCFATVHKDKTHRHPVTFSWEWNQDFYSQIQLEHLQSEFLKMLRTEQHPFGTVKVNKLRCKVKFRIHGFRHRKAIDLIRKGHSAEETMSYIGWQSQDSLTNYIKLSISDLKSFDSLEQCINFINN